MNVTINDLFEAGVHLGHQRGRWNAKSKGFIYDHRGGISIIDLEKTYQLLEKACTFAQELASKGQKILFVATKKQAQEVVREVATSLGMPFCVNRWLGGCLTNFETVRCSLNKYRRFLGMEADGTLGTMLKKEAAVIRRQMARMSRGFEGMLDVNNLPDALFVVDVNYEDIAVAEAHRLNIPVIAMVDTNSDPSLVTYPIPSNDDSVKSIRVILDTVADAINAGQSVYESKQLDAKKKRKIVAQEEWNGSVTMDADLAKEAEKVEEVPAETSTTTRGRAKGGRKEQGVRGTSSETSKGEKNEVESGVVVNREENSEVTSQEK